QLSELHPEAQRFFHEPPANSHTTMVVMTSNRGLCGALNVNVARTVMSELELRGKENTEVICLGKKGVQILSSFGVQVALAYDKDDTAATDTSLVDLSDLLYKKFLEKLTDHVVIVYPHFESAIKQQPVMRMLYPFPKFIPEHLSDESTNEPSANDNGIENGEHLYEPNAVSVLEYLIPRYGEIILYQALLESNASEHSARMVSMKNATDAAKDMATELTLEFNKARQASITKEIAEIASGAAALEQSSF
ncbi:MAG: ATP synthase F1 subunit gamma, partial [Candidatus Kerfeldbacteria bacterium]|nr:ATP synthase F1 subunit gamma [Candidatus Kerfeldbacteria bacterium]